MRRVFITSLLSALFVGIIVSWIFTQYVIPPIQEQNQSFTLEASQVALSEEAERLFASSAPTDFIAAAKKGRQSVVFVESEKNIKSDNYFTRKVTTQTGSGVIIDSDGYIVTNSHVVNEANSVKITLNNKREYQARLIGKDEQTDLALLKIEATGLPALHMGNSDNLLVGEWVIAIGNPFRLESTVTAGIVSAKSRNLSILKESGIESFIQTDAAVNSGNSGGALINTNGELVGINTAIVTSSGGYQGFSFAIPINLVRKVIRDLREFGSVQRAWLGITVEEVNADIAKEMSLKNVKGVRVVSTSKNGAARKAKLKKGDVILSIDDRPTDALPTFIEILGGKRPGEKITLKYVRDGKHYITEAILKNQLNTFDLVAPVSNPLLDELGIEIRNLDQFEKARYDDTGIYVVSILNNSVMDRVGIQPGFVISKMNGTKINDTRSLIKMIENYHGKMLIEGFIFQTGENKSYSIIVD